MHIIQHQFINESFYKPNWAIKHLFLGTFNPSGGEEVSYFYGRAYNRTWELLSNIFGEVLNPCDSKFMKLLIREGIACVDLISEVQIPYYHIDKVVGKGYSDSAIINGKALRTYNTLVINEIINNNKGINIYSTWGKGPNLKEWQKEISKIKGERIALVSPSMAARVPKGAKKFEYMLQDWMRKIKVP